MGLGLLVLPAMLLFMMLTILFLEIPHLAADLEPTSTQVLWILDIYGFLMAALLVLMGTLADRIGHRRLLVVGAAVFAVVSVLAATTNDPVMMIVWRAVLGVAAATQMPATLGLIFATFSDARQRGVAIGAARDAFTTGFNAGAWVAAGGSPQPVRSWQPSCSAASRRQPPPRRPPNLRHRPRTPPHTRTVKPADLRRTP